MKRRIDDFRPYVADRIAFLDRGKGINAPDVQSAIEELADKISKEHKIPFPFSPFVIDNFNDLTGDVNTGWRIRLGENNEVSLNPNGGITLKKIGESTVQIENNNISINKNDIVFISFIIHDKPNRFDIAMKTGETWSDETLATAITLKDNQYPLEETVVTSFIPATLGNVVNDTINGIRISLSREAGEVTFKKIGVMKNPHIGGLITLTFDDAMESHYNIAFPKMAEYGYRGVAYTPIKYLENDPQLKEKFKEMYNYGWDISVHGWHHDYDYSTPEKIKKEFIDSQNWLIKNGFFRSAKHLAYPGGYNFEPFPTVKNAYVTARGTGGETSDAIETLPPGDNFRIRVITASTSRDLDFYTDIIDNIHAGGGWGVFMFHGISETGEGSGGITTKTFNDIIEYIYEKKIKVSTMSEIEHYIPEYGAYRILK